MRDITVCKFGGSSLADAECFRRVREIIRSDNRRRYIVVSAPGKRNASDTKLTDLLIASHSLSAADRKAVLDKVRERFCRIAADLGIHPPYAALSRLGHFARTSRDAIASRGEYLCGILLAEYLDMPFTDPADIFLFRDGTLDIESTYDNLRHAGPSVIPGFYGADESGSIVTFPRGGSDITAAHVAAAISANLYENWTDVNGFFTADPAIVPDARHIPHLSLTQARQFSYLGAGVIHCDSIAPAANSGIPIIIKNTFFPECEGTLIASDARTDMPCVSFRKTTDDLYTVSCSNLSSAATANALAIIPEHIHITEYGDTISFECSGAEMHKLAVPLHAACIEKS